MKLGIRLRKLRNKNDYSQEYVASRLDMSQANYCRIEKDSLHISHEKLEIVAQIYGISLVEFFDENFNILADEEKTTKESFKISIGDLLRLKEQIIEVQLLEEKLKSIQA